MAGTAMAATVFDLSPTLDSPELTGNGGCGQGVYVSSTITISEMAFYVSMREGGNLKFMIWNGDNSSLLFSSTLENVAASSTNSWVYSAPFSYTLNAGSQYWFGFIAENDFSMGDIYPTITYSLNGLSAITTGNSNYSNYYSPTLGGGGQAEIGLKLSTSSQVPLPDSIILLGSGLMGLAGLSRRKLIKS